MPTDTTDKLLIEYARPAGLPTALRSARRDARRSAYTARAAPAAVLAAGDQLHLTG